MSKVSLFAQRTMKRPLCQKPDCRERLKAKEVAAYDGLCEDCWAKDIVSKRSTAPGRVTKRESLFVTEDN